VPAGTLTGGASSGIDCGGSGTTCSVGYASGTNVTLTAQPLGSDTFTGWSGGGCSGTALTCPVTMSQSRSVTATTSTAPSPVQSEGRIWTH
jgi:phospholipase C